jgi:hypothetical protein
VSVARRDTSIFSSGSSLESDGVYLARQLFDLAYCVVQELIAFFQPGVFGQPRNRLVQGRKCFQETFRIGRHCHHP